MKLNVNIEIEAEDSDESHPVNHLSPGERSKIEEDIDWIIIGNGQSSTSVVWAERASGTLRPAWLKGTDDIVQPLMISNTLSKLANKNGDKIFGEAGSE